MQALVARSVAIALVAGLALAGQTVTAQTAIPAAKKTAVSGPGKDQTVASRLKRLEDVEAIRRLLSDYIRFVDGQDYLRYSQLFAVDGELIFSGNRLKGPQAIRAQMEEGARRAPAQAAALAGSPHLNTDISVTVTGDEATASSRWTLVRRGGDSQPVVGATGHYDDRFVRVEGEWKFKRRVVYADIPKQDPFAPASSSSSSSGGGCDRDCLRGFLTQYLEALIAHKPETLPVADTVKFTEDTVEMRLGEGLWKSASRLRSYRQDVLDVRQGVAGAHVVLEEAGSPVMLVLRLKVANRKIAEAETMVVRSQREGLIFDVDALKEASKAMTLVPDRSQLNSRDELIKIAEHYPAGLRAGSFVTVNAPFASDAYRFENGRLMAGPGCTFMPGCDNIKAQRIPTLAATTHRLAAVDEQLGIVWFRLDFGAGSIPAPRGGGPGSTTGTAPAQGAANALIVWEAFKVHGGQIHAVEAFMEVMPLGAKSGWE